MTNTSIDERADAAMLAFHREMAAIALDDPMERGVPLAVLIDPALHDPLSDDEHAQRAPRLPLKIRAIDPARQPYLLLLGGSLMSERCVNVSLRIAVEESTGLHDRDGLRPNSVCAWLVPEDLESPNWQEIASSLAQRALVVPPVPPHGARPFRFWDSRVASHLQSAVGPGPWSECLRSTGLRQWWTLSEAADLMQIEASQPAAAGEMTSAEWRFDARQWRALQRLRWRNRLAQRARAWALPAPPTAALLDDVVQRALAWGLDHEADMRSFAHLALTTHPRFEEHPEAARMLRQWTAESRPAGGLAARTQAWSDDFLDALAQGAWLRDSADELRKLPKL